MIGQWKINPEILALSQLQATINRMEGDSRRREKLKSQKPSHWEQLSKRRDAYRAKRLAAARQPAGRPEPVTKLPAQRRGRKRDIVGKTKAQELQALLERMRTLYPGKG